MKQVKISDIKSNFTSIGRTLYCEEDGILYFNWTCSGIELIFRGTCLMVSLHAAAGEETVANAQTGQPENYLTWPYAAVFLDDCEQPDSSFCVEKEQKTCLLFQSELPELHRIRLVKLTENGKTGLGAESFYMDGEILPAVKDLKKPLIEFIGDSITCGFGNTTKEKDRLFFSEDENGWLSYGAIAARRLDMNWSIISSSGICVTKYPNWPHAYEMNGLYDYTDRIQEDRQRKDTYQEWDFSSHPAAYIVLNLGTNDANAMFLSGDSEAAEQKFCRDYLAFLKHLRHKNGTETQIICALGSIDYYLYHHITEIVKEYQAITGDSRISCLQYPKIYFRDPVGACGHPYVATHEKMAEALVLHIRKLSQQSYSPVSTQ